MLISLALLQVAVLCWTYGLYDAMIYVYTRGMNDYSTPLQELLRLLRASVSSGSVPLSDTDLCLGYKLLVYISCCLAGRAYPTGQIREELVEPVRVAIFSMLVKKQLDEPSPNEPVETYPHLRTLLRCAHWHFEILKTCSQILVFAACIAFLPRHGAQICVHLEV